MVDIFTSSELGLAGFSMTQLSGERLLKVGRGESPKPNTKLRSL